MHDNGLVDMEVEEEDEKAVAAVDEEMINMQNKVDEVLNLPDRVFNAFVDVLRQREGDKGEMIGETLCREREI